MRFPHMSLPIRWIPVAEQMPEDREVVVVFQYRGPSLPEGRIFAGFMSTDDRDVPCWYGHQRSWDGCPAWNVAECGDVRVMDFWLPLPKEPPDHNVVDGGWPA